MVSITKNKIRKYKSKKCNSRLKNKIAKYSRKLLRGGAKPLIITIPQRSHTTNPNTKYQKSSLKSSLIFKIPIPNTKNNIIYNNPSLTEEEKILREYYKKELMNVDIPEFTKYKCFYKEDAKYVDHISYLYEKKQVVNNEIETYRVYAPTNQAISIEYKVVSTNEPKYKEIGKLFDITPLELSVDIMQLAINTGKIEISSDTQGNSYLGFIDFPSLVIKDKPAGTSFSFTSRTYANWISVYEEQFEESDTKFDLIKTHDERHIDKNTLEKEIKILIEKIRILEEMKLIRTNTDPIKIEESKKLLEKLKSDLVNIALVNEMSNEELFVMKQNEMRTLLDKDSFDEEQKAKIEEQVKYRAYVRIEDDKEDDKEDDTDVSSNTSTNKASTIEPTTTELSNEPSTTKLSTNEPYIISEDISWVMQNALWLEKYLELGGKSIENLEKNYILNSTKYECDLSGLSQQYIIVDEFVNNEEGGDNESYVICGYPDKKMKAIILNFWQNETMKAELDKVHQEQKDNFYEWFSKLFNDYIEKVETEKIHFDSSNKVLLNELYKLYFKPRKNWFYNEINKRYKDMFPTANKNNKSKENKDNNYVKFTTDFEKNCKEYFNDISQQYLNTIISYINYVFLVFKKNEDMSLTPAFFSIKELEKKHIPILERINKFIRNQIPIIFDIKQIKHIDTNPRLETIQKSYNEKDTYIQEKPTFVSDNEYKLFYTHYTYGEVFLIRTEYLHTMSNLGHKAHTYANRITIEEIIYSCSLKKRFWKNHKINYDIREYRLLKKYNKKLKKKNRSDILLEEIEKIEKIEKSLQTETKTKTEKDKQTFVNINIESKIILMYKNSSNQFIFIYLYNNKIYKLILQPNLKDCIDDIIQYYNNKTFNINISKLFKIMFNNELDNDYIKNMFAYNPSTLINIKSPISTIHTDKIDVTLYYNTNMKTINDKQIFLMPQLYGSYSPIYTKNIDDSLLKDRTIEYENYKKEHKNEHKNLDDCKEIRLFLQEYETQLKNKELIMNCAYINVDECGYNFWEFLNIKENKLIVFIVPYEESINTPYLGNYYYLDNRHIKMLIAFKNKYYNNNNNCFIMLSRSLSNNTFHFHIIKKDEYKIKWRSSELGLSMLRSININKIINNINTFSLYYKNIDYLIIGV
jgi:hypothetical protein